MEVSQSTSMPLTSQGTPPPPPYNMNLVDVESKKQNISDLNSQIQSLNRQYLACRDALQTLNVQRDDIISSLSVALAAIFPDTASEDPVAICKKNQNIPEISDLWAQYGPKLTQNDLDYSAQGNTCYDLEDQYQGVKSDIESACQDYDSYIQANQITAPSSADIVADLNSQAIVPTVSQQQAGMTAQDLSAIQAQGVASLSVPPDLVEGPDGMAVLPPGTAQDPITGQAVAVAAASPLTQKQKVIWGAGILGFLYLVFKGQT